MKSNDDKPLVFAEWSFVKGNLVQRRDFMYMQLVNQNDNKNSFLGDFEDKPIKNFSLVHYLLLKENDNQ